MINIVSLMVVEICQLYEYVLNKNVRKVDISLLTVEIWDISIFIKS